MTKRTLFTVLVGLFAFAGAMLWPFAVSAQSFQCQPSVRIDKSDCLPAQPGNNGWFCNGMNYRDCSNPIGNPDCNADCTDQTNCSTGAIFTGSVCSSNDTCILRNDTSAITNLADCSRCIRPSDEENCEATLFSGIGSYSCHTGYSCGCSRTVAYCGMTAPGVTPPPSEW